MAYSKEEIKEIYKQALKAIEENCLYFIEDVISFIPMSKATFYDYFKLESNELNTIKSKLNDNKVNTKIQLREDFKKGASVEKLALYKLLGTEEERKKLSQQYHDLTTKGDSMNKPYDLSKLSDDELSQLDELTQKLGNKGGEK